MRSTVIGEAAWVTTLGILTAVHASALWRAGAAPEATDFAAFMLNARGWIAGSPYPAGATDPNVPHVILVFAAFAGLSTTVGLTVWLLLSYICAVAAVRRVAHEVRRRISVPVTLTAIAVLLASPPALIVAATGNMTWPLCWIFTVAWSLDRNGHRTAAAGLVGLLISAKPFLGLWLPYYLLRQAWASLATATAAALLATACSVAITGIDAWRAWIDMLERVPWYDLSFNVSALGVIARIDRPEILPWIVVCCAVGGITGHWLRRSAADVDRDWAVLVLTSMLLSPLAWRYYLLLGLGPLTLLTVRGGLSAGAVAMLAAFTFAPVALVEGGTAVTRATLGSLAFWLLVFAWTALGLNPAPRRPNAGLRMAEDDADPTVPAN
jgi:hypothetical protein